MRCLKPLWWKIFAKPGGFNKLEVKSEGSGKATEGLRGLDHHLPPGQPTGFTQNR